MKLIKTESIYNRSLRVASLIKCGHRKKVLACSNFVLMLPLKLEQFLAEFIYSMIMIKLSDSILYKTETEGKRAR
jgi:hypothetical protein